MSLSLSLLSSPDVSATMINSVVDMPDDDGGYDDDNDEDGPLVSGGVGNGVDISICVSDDEAETLIPDTLPHYSSLPPLFDSPLPPSSPFPLTVSSFILRHLSTSLRLHPDSILCAAAAAIVIVTTF